MFSLKWHAQTACSLLAHCVRLSPLRTVDDEHGELRRLVFDIVKLRVTAMQPRRLAHFLRRYGLNLLPWLWLLLCFDPATSARASDLTDVRVVP